MSPAWDVFVSYSSRNARIARRLVKDLERNGYRPFLAESSIPPGATWQDEIQKALEECRAGVLLLSDEAAASRRVQEEVTFLLEREVPLIPVLHRISRQLIDYRLRNLQLLDLRHGYGRLLRELLRALPPPGSAIGPGRPPAAPPGPSLPAIFAAFVGVVLLFVILRSGWTLIDEEQSFAALRRHQLAVQSLEARLDEILPPGAGAQVRGDEDYYDPQTGEKIARDIWEDERLRWRRFFVQGRLVAHDEFEYGGERRERVTGKIRSYFDEEQKMFLEDIFTSDGYLVKKLDHRQGDPPIPRFDDMVSPLPPQGLLIYYR